jgi:cellobiose-specific phosphotransferase system component IIB
MRQQPYAHSMTTVVAIVGAATLSEGILARLLEREGYATTIIEAYPTGPIDELLDDVDILLVAPGLKDGVREGFLEAVRNAPKTAIPVLPLSAALKQALLDEVSVSLCWRVLLKELVQELEYALARGAVASTEALAVDNDEVV